MPGSGSSAAATDHVVSVVSRWANAARVAPGAPSSQLASRRVVVDPAAAARFASETGSPAGLSAVVAKLKDPPGRVADWTEPSARVHRKVPAVKERPPYNRTLVTNELSTVEIGVTPDPPPFATTC